MRKHGFAILLVFLLTSAVFAPVDGYKTGKYNSSSGCGCHTSSNTLTATLTGTPVEYNPGSTYSLSIGITTSHSSGGFSMVASDGTFSNPSADAKVNSQGTSVTHSTWTSTSWSVDWTAPSTGTGTATLSLAVLGGNGQQNTGGDAVGTASYSIPESTTANTAPTITGLSITPQLPVTSDTLVASYTFNDADGDQESGTTYAWKLNGSLVPSLTASTVDFSQTAKHQSWTVEVTPSDGIDTGQIATSSTTTIANTPPSITQLDASDLSPSDSTDITYSLVSSDADDDPLMFEIQWMLDGTVVSELNNATSLPSVATRDGDVWQVRVRAHDGEAFSPWTTSDAINIGPSANNPPVATNVLLSVTNPVTTDAITMSWDESDTDGDSISQRSTRWVRDGLVYEPANELVTLPSTMTQKGESWSGEVRLFDGTSWSAWEPSPSVYVSNSAPNATNLSLFSPSSTVAHDLEIHFEGTDDDGDSTQVTSIVWLQNGEVMEGQDQLRLNKSLFTKGDVVVANLILSDGEVTSSATTAGITILNAPPVVSIQWPENVTSLDDLTPLVIVTDADQDQTTVTKTWYKNGFRDGNMDGESTVSSDRTEPEQIWTLAVVASDGTENSTLTEGAITIPNIIPQAIIRAVSQNAWNGELFAVTGTDSVDLDGRIVEYIWSWQGGQIVGPSFEIILDTYAEVTLTVRDEYGAEHQTSLEINAENGPKVTNAEILVEEGKVDLSWDWNGEPIQFNVWRNGNQIATVNTTEYHDEPPLSGLAVYYIQPVVDDRILIAGASSTTATVEAPVIEAPQASQAAGTWVGILFIFAGIAISAPQYLRRGEPQ
ncbi:MAG: hypothetical protein CMA65_05240 [Euryarchaeota archaeon]|nr:hypothetical protein [Euryarchaeota archaeon]